MLKFEKLFIILFILFTTNTHAQNLDWTVGYGGSDLDRPNSITTDNMGNVYTVGSFESSNFDIDPSANLTTYFNPGGFDWFMQKLDSNGNFVWGKHIGSGSSNFFVRAGNIIIDSNSNSIYTIVTFEDTIDINPGPGVFTVNVRRSNSNCAILKLDANGDFVWAKHMPSPQYNESTDLCFDALGNLLHVGCFRDSIDMDPNAGVFNLTANGPSDFFIQKIDTNGNLLWAKSIGGADRDVIDNAMINSNNEIILSGRFSGTTDFDPSMNTSSLTATGSFYDGFVLKLDANGNFVWVKHLSGTHDITCNAMACFSNNDIGITGSFRDTIDFDPSNNVVNKVSLNSGSDIFILKLDANGQFVWVEQIGNNASGFEMGEDLIIDSKDNIITTGRFGPDTLDFDPGPGIFNLNSNSTRSAFFQKLDANGNFIWAYGINGNGTYESGNALHLDAKGNLYTAGLFGQSGIDFDPSSNIVTLPFIGRNDVFLQKIRPNEFPLNLKAVDAPAFNFTVRPNPTAGEFIVSFETLQRTAYLRIFSATGQLIKQKKIRNSRQTKLSIKEPIGVYFIEVQTENDNRSVQKIIKESN